MNMLRWLALIAALAAVAIAGFAPIATAEEPVSGLQITTLASESGSATASAVASTQNVSCGSRDVKRDDGYVLFNRATCQLRFNGKITARLHLQVYDDNSFTLESCSFVKERRNAYRKMVLRKTFRSPEGTEILRDLLPPYNDGSGNCDTQDGMFDEGTPWSVKVTLKLPLPRGGSRTLGAKFFARGSF